ncbi:MDR family MFS transporter [Leucobacter sp. wl10]|uniref:MDR family MFS transporter n=1 Tax=Leucobacter sp. wl10 TaxID=2304677 RepID=UPI000E5C323C|nr:MDR family MFS transporter [Leucobacter sp. wl10]RGE23795.1 DHA2 family efflux MFS transporter permease subunit [Leucobacter sp. wl10]
MTTDTAAVRVPARTDGIDPAGMRVIWLLLVAAFVAILNETTMAIAIPALNAALGIPPELGQWLTSAFMLTMAVVIPTTGFLLQRFTTRQVFLAAIISFVAGTAICLLAPGFTMLLLGRIVQAAGTGIMMPLLMTTMMNVVPPRSRGRMMGRVGLVMSLAPAAGPTLSGLVLDQLGWRWLFGIILPIAVVALLLGAKWMTNLGETSRAPIDVLSIILSAVAFGGIVFGLSQLGGGEGGPAGAPRGALPWVVLASGTVFLVLFVWRQLALQRRNDALLDLRVFASRNYVVAVIIMGVVALSMFGTFSLLPLYLQNVAGLEPTAAGLVLLPGSLLMGLLGPVMGRVYDLRGPRTLLVPGTILIATSMFIYSTVGEHTPTWFLVIVQIMMSLGLAGSFTPLFSASLGSLDRSLYSHGSAVLNTLQQVGGAAGTAVLISIYSTSLRSGEAEGLSTAAAGEPGANAAFLTAACIALVPVVLAFFVKKPVDQEGGPAGH